MEMPNVMQPVQAVKKFDFKKYWPYVLGSFLVVLAGIGTAWLINAKFLNKGATGAAPGAKVSANEAGILNPSFDYDEAEGILKDGGINGEGTHHLERDGGPSKYVYLASSVIDLQSFVDKKVQVWGETQAAKKAGWFMDVAKIKLVE
ncbi:MAG: hypothetical protein UX13_C0045G0004 [Candidatus Woesebacteria bacterium GW2011_GWB1_45_5]|uniref:Uncharacterized protein n=1 Tax=Candidatus Woesebacteria bacterium GW2011_GWB1_45_5 TaxID=1618581 RepID=A0A0G1QKU0_9BACT|nr:MAG: hypothetical protein UX13_C0045G0004 [Candidatus Woesebacteria bacterium GW2011_GWB1_45_5]